MASTLLNSVVRASIYAINSNPALSRTTYPYGMDMFFGTGSITIQGNTGDGSVGSLEAGRTAGAALVYTKITQTASGTVFFSGLTMAQVATNLAS